MPLCLLALIGAPIFLSMGWTHARFTEMAQLEKAVIGLDNASILAGQSARAVWRGLQFANGQMRILETAHHAAHACARAPIPNPACRVADTAFEARLRLYHAWSGKVARQEWIAGKQRAQDSAREMGGKLQIQRDTEPPVHSVFCRVCGLPTAWEVSLPYADWLTTRVHQRIFQNKVESVGQSLEGSGPWQYRVREVENAK